MAGARAAQALEPYPRSWLARAIGAPSAASVRTSAPSQEAQLTPAQRAVFDLLMQGRKTDEIAKALGRSTYTVRNHVKLSLKSTASVRGRR
jgi:DNA-binding CsgD family transcriptional regulator